MNLSQFLSQVDEASGSMPQEQLRSLLREAARRIPERGREQFVELMSTRKTASISQKEHLAEQVRNAIRMIEALSPDAAHPRRLTAYIEDEWDDWDDDDEEDDVRFLDPDGVFQDLEKAAALLYACLDASAYEEGTELVLAFAHLEIDVSGDSYSEGDPLTVPDLFEENLWAVNMNDFYAACLQLLYLTNESAEARVSAMLAFLRALYFPPFSLEYLFQSARTELPDMKGFLAAWISALPGEPDCIGTRGYMKDAFIQIGEDEVQLQVAMKSLQTHPGLLEDYILSHQKAAVPARMLEICRKAVSKIPKKLLIRGRIAILGAHFACLTQEDPQPMWLEAFRSDTTVTNLMRLLFFSKEGSLPEEQIKSIVRNARAVQGPVLSPKELSPNIITHDVCGILLYFTEQYDEMVQKEMRVRQGLGWSGTFIENGITLMLLSMFSDVPPATRCPALHGLLHRLASSCPVPPEELYAGTGRIGQGEQDGMEADENLFLTLLGQWKSSHQVPEETLANWEPLLETWIDMRVQAILGKSNTFYYAEAAELVAALGEAMENRGYAGRKKELLGHYSDKYSRRTKFRSELKRYL